MTEFATVASNKAVGKDPEFERLNTLLSQREVLEMEADAIGSELRSPGPNGEPPAGLKDPLVDAEGFPRADIDIFRVRSQRHRLAEINTDYRKLMKDIDEETKRVHTLKAAAPRINSSDDERKGATRDSSGSYGNSGSDIKYESIEPIATLDEILDNSPSCEAGILDGDLLLAFGAVSSATHQDPMNAIPNEVKTNIGKPITVIIKRNDKIEKKYIVPKTWDGRGLLGCHLSKLR